MEMEIHFREEEEEEEVVELCRARGLCVCVLACKDLNDPRRRSSFLIESNLVVLLYKRAINICQVGVCCMWKSSSAKGEASTLILF